MGVPARINAIHSELEAAAQEYAEAKDSVDAARVRFDSAREKFAGVRRLAGQMLTAFDLGQWMVLHENVRYAAQPIGEAIVEVLRNHAWFKAWDYVLEKDHTFLPAMTIDEIVRDLETGGADFKSSTPRREVNAALIRLKGVGRLSGKYVVDEAADLLKRVQDIHAAQETERRAEGGTAE